jgi:hypothetical protein
MPAIIRIAVKRGNEMDFFKAEFFSYCERKIIVQEIFQEMESPESMVLSPYHGFLSLIGFGKLGSLPLRHVHPKENYFLWFVPTIG